MAEPDIMVYTLRLAHHDTTLMKIDDHVNTESAPQSSVQDAAPAAEGTPRDVHDEQAAGPLDSAVAVETAVQPTAGAGEVEAEDATGSEVGSEPEAKSRGKSIIRELVETVLIVLAVFLVVRAVVQNFVVEGDSMLPTLHSEQYLLVNKAAYFQYDSNFLGRLFNAGEPSSMHYLFGSPSRGDIVVLESPNESKDLIKRVIAVAGETVEVKADPDPTGRPGSPCGDCGVYVDSKRLDEPYIKATPDYTVEPLVVPDGYVYVLGDNRRNSQDSHVFGPLPTDHIIGTAFLSYWPSDRFGFLPHPGYPAAQQP